MLNPEQHDTVLQAARNCIDIEAQVVTDLKKQIQESFIECVQLIYECSGRLVVTGIGKSAIIGQKMVATFNSTGTPAIFMHAADAIHGDLGMIRPEDIVLCISKSGETPEIKVLLPLVKNLGSQLIAMVSNVQSSLAQQANLVIWIPVDKEAEPNNLAPTASTTAQMVMGDALAVSLLALRGFTPMDFAQFHPGGSLGKQLYLKVKDVYPLHEKPAVFEYTALNEVILEMTSKRLGMTAVLNQENKLVGIITDGDLRRMLQKTSSMESLQAKDIMSANPVRIAPDALAVEAFKVLKDRNITQVIVADDDRYLGVIHIHDLIKEGII